MTLAKTTAPVILNLFQDPFLNIFRSAVGQSGARVLRLKAQPERAARWALKQVQDDEVGMGSVVA